MSDILAPRQRQVLAEFARSNVLLAFDFDGTLSPIVDHPGSALVPPETRDLLCKLARLYPIAVISGRRTADARMLLRGTGIRHIVGNHGADLAPTSTESRKLVAGWRTSLNKELAGLEGVWVEDKGLSLTVHYRNSPDRLAMRRCVWAAAGGLAGARIMAAKEAVNVLLPSMPDKGEALRILQQQLGCERVIFVGDDHTDEDVFSRDWGGTLLGVNVGTRKSAASYQLRGQGDVDRFLDILAGLREPPHRDHASASAALRRRVLESPSV